VIPQEHRLLLEKIYSDPEKIEAWFNNHNPAFHGLSPREMLLIGRTDEVLKFLQAYLSDSQIFRG
jgi:hypothetical protein